MRIAKSAPLSSYRQKGFTLLELLIASIIFAIMAVMAYGGLSNVMDNSKSSEAALKRLQQIQQTIIILNRDFLQLIPRTIRDEYGNIQPAISTETNIDYVIEFTRGGRVNPANILRSTLVRVAYRIKDEKLIRLQWSKLDNAPGVEAKETVLLDNIKNINIRFLAANAEWQQQWPPLNATNATNTGNPTELNSIEIVLQLNDWGDIRRLYAMN